MAVGEELWVGLGNGHVVIFDVIKNNTYEDEAYVVLNENEGAWIISFVELSKCRRVSYRGGTLLIDCFM